MNVQEKIKVITEGYGVLVSTLPISNAGILSSLRTEGVITAATQRQIRIERLERNQVMLLLDTVILRSLRVGMVELYDGLVKVLEKSTDPVANEIGKGLREGNIGTKRPPEKIIYSTDNAKKAIRSMYVELVDGTPIELLIPELVANEIITQYDKAKIETMPTSVKKTSYLLDEKIILGLNQNVPEMFKDFLKILEGCNDRIAKNLAFKLKVKCGITELPPEEPTIPEEVGSGLEKYLKDSVSKGSACYRAKEPWIYAVCRISVQSDPLASGFVGTLTIDEGNNKRTITVLVTNNHVFQRLDQAREANYEFGCLRDDHDDKNQFQPDEIEGKMLIPEKAMFLTDERMDHVCARECLDYTVVEVDEELLKKTKFCSKVDGITYSIYDCKFDLDKHVRFTPTTSEHDTVVSIYHHPKGDILKKSSQQTKRCDYLLFYLCDTEGGSSGSPIVKTTDDENRQVIGLHRGFYKIGGIMYNFGSTMSAIVDHIHKKPPKYAERKELLNMLKQK